MKPSELEPLIGRTVEVYWNGLRCGKVVAAPASDTLTVQLAPVYGRHRIDVGAVACVFWYGKKRELIEWLAERKGAKE